MTDNVNDDRLVKLSSLIQFEREVRQAESRRDLGYILVNDVRQVADFRQAFLWHEDEFRRVRIQAASNIAEVDHNAPAIRNLLALAEQLRDAPGFSQIKTFSIGELEGDAARQAADQLDSFLLSIPVRSASGAVTGGLVLSSAVPWNEAQLALLDVVGEAASHAWNAHGARDRASAIKAHFARCWRRYVLALVVLFLLPVRQYVLAPAEVVPREPEIIASPLQGVVDQVHVEPNQRVAAGQLLFEMENTDLRNEYRLAQKSLEVAKAEYLRNAQQSFGCEECRGKAPELRAMMEREQAAVEWAREQLEMSDVNSPVDGIVTFTDITDLEGRPVNTGQKIMAVSRPEQVRLRIKLPVEDAIELEPGSEVVFYPNVDPLNRYQAKLASSSYEASPTPDGILAFTLHARFNGEKRPRLGLHGTAKLYGNRMPLAYLVLRKPLSWLRRTVGI